MTAVLIDLLAPLWPFVLAFVGAGFLYFKGRSDGGARADARQARRDRAAVDERMEMHREASEFERRAAGMTDAELDRKIGR